MRHYLAAGRVCAAAAVFLYSLAAGLVFEGSAKADIARSTAETALAQPAARARIDLLQEGAGLIEGSWAHPTVWHGGANETLSWIYARLAEESGESPHRLALSAEAASRAVAMAPIQPAAWARLASLADRGAATPCAPEVCLERSWMASKFIDTPTGCARLRLAQRHGMLKPYDERVKWFARNALHEKEVMSCLDFLPQPELYAALMEFSIQDAAYREGRAP